MLKKNKTILATVFAASSMITDIAWCAEKEKGDQNDKPERELDTRLYGETMSGFYMTDTGEIVQVPGPNGIDVHNNYMLPLIEQTLSQILSQPDDTGKKAALSKPRTIDLKIKPIENVHNFLAKAKAYDVKVTLTLDNVTEEQVRQILADENASQIQSLNFTYKYTPVIGAADFENFDDEKLDKEKKDKDKDKKEDDTRFDNDLIQLVHGKDKGKIGDDSRFDNDLIRLVHGIDEDDDASFNNDLIRLAHGLDEDGLRLLQLIWAAEQEEAAQARRPVRRHILTQLIHQPFREERREYPSSYTQWHGDFKGKTLTIHQKKLTLSEKSPDTSPAPMINVSLIRPVKRDDVSAPVPRSANFGHTSHDPQRSTRGLARAFCGGGQKPSLDTIPEGLPKELLEELGIKQP